MNVPESKKLKQYMVLSYIIDNPEECIKKAIEDDTEKYIENINTHYSVFFDTNEDDIFGDLGGFKRMISESVFDTREEIIKTSGLDQSVYEDIIKYTSENIRDNKEDTIEYLIKRYRTGSLYSILQLENTLNKIYDNIRDDEMRLKKVLAVLGYIDDFIEDDVTSYLYYFYSETEDIYVNISDKDMMLDKRFMFDYTYVEKIDYILNEYDKEIINKGIETLD